MFSTVYVVWAIFLFRSARAPQANRLFLDFNLTANSAHFGVMLIMAVTMPDEHQHIAGVLAAGNALHGPIGGMLATDPASQERVIAGGTQVGMVERVSAKYMRK